MSTEETKVERPRVDWQVELSPSSARLLAKELLRAQSYASEVIEEETNGWPKSYLDQLPRVEKGATVQQRLEAIGQLRPHAQAAMKREAEAEEKAKAEFEERKQKRLKAEAETLEANKLQNKAILASWEAQVAAAKSRGLQEPPKPTNLYPEDSDSLARARYRDSVQANF